MSTPDSSVPDEPGARLTTGASDDRPSLRAPLSYVMWAWLFGAAWMAMASGAVLTRFAKQTGLSEFGFGLLGAIPYFAYLFQLPASYLLERFGRRKAVFMVACLAHRFLWVLIALVPWVLPRSAWWQSLLAMVALSAVLASFSTPAWMGWMADLIPSRIRGRFFSRRSQLGQIVCLVVSLAAGFLLDKANMMSPRALQITLSAMLLVGGLFGMADILLFKPVPDAAAPRPSKSFHPWHLLRQPLKDRNFRLFLGYTATMTLAVGFISQFIWLYLFDVVGFTNFQANLWLNAVPIVVMVAVYRAWGRVIDRLGRKPVLLICGLCVIPGGGLWVFITPDHFWAAYVLALLVTAMWPGLEVANTNMLLGASESRDGRRYGSAFVALYYVVVAVAGTLSGLLAGALANALGREWKAYVLGWPITYHGVLFMTSSVIRLGAIFWLIGIQDRGAFGTRYTLRYMTSHLYSNVQGAMFAPLRLTGRLIKGSFKLNPRR